MRVGWKERSALAVLLLFVLALAVVVLEHGLNPEEACSRCLPSSRPVSRSRFLAEGTSTNRICPRCGIRWWSDESAILYAVRRTWDRAP